MKPVAPVTTILTAAPADEPTAPTCAAALSCADHSLPTSRALVRGQSPRPRQTVLHDGHRVPVPQHACRPAAPDDEPGTTRAERGIERAQPGKQESTSASCRPVLARAEEIGVEHEHGHDRSPPCEGFREGLVVGQAKVAADPPERRRTGGGRHARTGATRPAAAPAAAARARLRSMPAKTSRCSGQIRYQYARPASPTGSKTAVWRMVEPPASPVTSN